ncbi:toprim domain-containing protein [Niabella aurantiaca]|uniref:toprim domain-containing protein n=1 Tax=Niabella aurantiaca TaxID=379900 RepID=UPI00037C2E19|nr:toprim domain-containing protein [Niabella aurantiaca]
MNIDEAKALDMVQYLSSLGHEPARVSGNSYWYHSPLHADKTPSFKINRQLNRWYDFAEGKGGNLVDFGILYHQCNISDLLQKLSGPSVKLNAHQRLPDKPENNKTIKILSAHPVNSLSLVRYLHYRRIPLAIAEQYLSEVRYQLGDRTYYALGFKNDSGGYELRNEKFKGSSSPKDVTFIDNGAKELAVFEGSFNFLSYLTMYYKQEQQESNFMILNSTAFFEKSLPKMREHDKVHLYMDNDKTGQNCTLKALALDNKKFIDESRLYKNYGDLNDWLMHIGNHQKQQLRQKP